MASGKEPSVFVWLAYYLPVRQAPTHEMVLSRVLHSGRLQPFYQMLD